MLTDTINNILDTMAPIKTYQVRKNYCPWLSDKTKELISKRNIVQKKASHTGKEEDWTEYKHLRNQINSRLKTEKNSWKKHKLESLSADTSGLWGTVKDWIGWNNGGPPTQLFDGRKLCSKPSELTNIMNNYFIKKVNDLRSSFGNTTGDPYKLPAKLMKNRKCSLQ